MKKQILFVAALALTFAACQPNYDVENKTIATFEEAAISPAAANSEFKLDSSGVFTSGNFIFHQTAMPAANYFSRSIVSNHTDTTFVDYNDAWKAVAGGAHGGKNYVVWNMDYYGNDTISLVKAAKVPGFYVSNSVYTYNSIINGDWSGPAFAAEDWLLLTITGIKDNKATGSVEFYLAEGTSVVEDWTFVDLSKLGVIDGLFFTMTGSRTGDYGLNTPAYFAFDDLGAKK